jgi:DNA-binding MarR family transcriptional regulator
MDPKTELPIALRASYLTLHRRSDALFAPHGVTADQFVLLATLAQGNALTQRELAQRMDSDPSTVRAMLVLLEKHRLIRRETHPEDARARTVYLTPAGQRKFRSLWKAGERIREQMFRSLQPGEAKTLVVLLKRITSALNPDLIRIGESISQHPHEDQT